MTTLLICIIPLAFIAGVFCALKSVQIGLRWNIQVQKTEQPTMADNPIQTVVEAVQQGKAEKANEYTKNQIKEWMFGE